MLPLVARDLSLTYGDRVVLDGLDLLAHPGRPLGLVGENGAGKSTLLRLLAGLEPPDGGTVEAPDDLGHLGQEPSFGDQATLGAVLDAALAPLHDAVRRLESLGERLALDPAIADDYAATLAWAQDHEAWDADRRAEVAAQRLGLGSLDRDRPVAAMSGGERTRLALAALVVRRPEAVLLDEPSNHLDDDALAYLEDFLRGLPGVVVVASHDRMLLERVVDQIVDLDPAHLGTDGDGGNRFSGGYRDYLLAKRSARARWEQAFADQQDELEGLRRALRTTARTVAHDRPPRDNDRYVYHFKAGNVARTVSRRVRDVESRIAAIEREPVPKPPRPLRLRGDLVPARVRREVPAVVVRDLVVPARLRLDRLDVPTGGHVLVTGANGSGKSTLLKVLAGELVPAGGSVQVTAYRRGHLPQDVVFSDPSRTAEETFEAAGGSLALRDLGLVHPRDAHRPVGVLSVGQQRRLGLAVVLARRPDLLLLDEPTNHISLALADELETALGASPATVLLASHDRWLRSRWGGPTLALSPCAG